MMSFNVYKESESTTIYHFFGFIMFQMNINNVELEEKGPTKQSCVSRLQLIVYRSVSTLIFEKSVANL